LSRTKTFFHVLIVSERKTLSENNIRLNIIGEIERLPDDVQRGIERTMALTKDNQSLLLNIALSYGGRSEIVRMAQRLASRAKNGRIEPAAITPEMVADHLYTSGIPDPDLLIRTSGEMRISNFLLWQIAVISIMWSCFARISM